VLHDRPRGLSGIDRIEHEQMAALFHDKKQAQAERSAVTNFDLIAFGQFAPEVFERMNAEPFIVIERITDSEYELFHAFFSALSNRTHDSSRIR
jgi:hypothetical protein